MAIQHTKNQIMECALRMAEKKPVNKITVRDIVEECQITRNTFYYYFHDIYDVFTTYIDNRIDGLIKQGDVEGEDAVFDFLELCTEYKNVFINLYKSIGHERLSKFAEAKLERLIIMAIEKEYDIEKIPPLDLEIICTFYEEAMLGILLRWLQDRKYDDPVDIKHSLDRIRKLFEGQLDLLIKNSSKN